MIDEGPPDPLQTPFYCSPSDGTVTNGPCANRLQGKTWFRDEHGRIRTAWRLLFFWLAWFLLQIPAGMAQLAAVAVHYFLLTGEWDLEAALSFFRTDFVTPAIYSAATTGLMTVLLVVVFRRFVDRRPISSMGWKPWNLKTLGSVALGTLAGFLLMTLSTVLILGLGGLQLRLGQPHWDPIILFLPLLVAAFMEEIIIRGYMLQNFLDRARPIVGIIASTLVFWLLHGLNPDAWSSPWPSLNLLLAGILLSEVYILTDNIWAPTALHFAWNYTQGPLLGIAVSGIPLRGILHISSLPEKPNWLHGGPFGLEGSAITAGLLAAVVAWMGPHCWRHYKKKASSSDA